MKIAVHITHEAMKKIGGIGAVLNGVCTTKAYKSFFGKTVLYGPLFGSKGDIYASFGNGGELLFSSVDGYDKDNYGEVFNPIKQKYNIDIVYGRRILFDEFENTKKDEVDVFLVGTASMNQDEVNKVQVQAMGKIWDSVRFVRA